MDAGRVQAIGRFVENQDSRISEQRAGQRETLLHAEGEAANPPPCRACEVDLCEHVVDAAHGDVTSAGEHPKMVASRASRMEAGRFQNGTHVSSWLV